jgi:hypothetical protein
MSNTQQNLKTYRVTFSRSNFTLRPIAKQCADVIFQSDKALGDGNAYHCEVSSDAWDAMRIQNPHWDNPEFPVAGMGGWSSVMADSDIIDITTVEVDLGTPGEGKPRIGETFSDDNRQYRVSAFYKYYVPEMEEKEAFLAKLIAKKDAEREAKNERLIVPCLREEAELIGGDGVAGIIIPIEGLIITGLVGWDNLTIQREREDYRVQDSLPFAIYQHWVAK